MGTRYYLIKGDDYNKYNHELNKIKQFVKLIEMQLKQNKIEHTSFTIIDFKNSLKNELIEPEEIDICRTSFPKGEFKVKWIYDEKSIRDKVNKERYIIQDSYERTYTLDEFFAKMNGTVVKK